jgi:hypothetical protein
MFATEANTQDLNATRLNTQTPATICYYSHISAFKGLKI